MNTNSSRISVLNDLFRQRHSVPVPGLMMATEGIAALSPDVQFLIWSKVKDFRDFDEGNDPYEEHDFGSFVIPSIGLIFWKIDYFADETMQTGSADPSDPNRSFRVLTVMLASEY